MGLSRDRISAADAERLVADLKGWRLDGDRLRKTYVFKDFIAAFGFMAAAAIEAEKLNHHPNWSNVYKTVEVELWTHDVGGLTEFDFTLAAAMDRRA